jgi:late competence protein required for DNA uptake (superfamily II DNA/RNA helicase)
MRKTAYFQRALQTENWVEVYNQENVNRKFNIFHNTCLLILEDSFPLVYKKKKDTNKWITKGIRISCNHKGALYILLKKSSDDRLKLYYKRYCIILMRVIKEAKNLYYQKLISNSENKIQLTWMIINKETVTNQAPDKYNTITSG